MDIHIKYHHYFFKLKLNIIFDKYFYMDSYNKINLDFITLRDGVLNISGYLRCDAESEVIGICNGFEIKPDSFDYPTRCGKTIFNFDFKIPVEDENLKIELKSTDVDYPIHFRKFCNMSYFSRYYVKDNKIVYFDGAFNVVNFSYFKMLKLECGDLLEIIKKRPSFYIQAVIFRFIHLLFYVFMKNKEIWIVMDRKTMADDNAEHFFKYAIKQNDGVRKYFAIHNSSKDFERLNKLFSGHILDADSVKHRFYYMFASKLISSQGSEFDLNPFLNKNYSLTSGICNLDFYFLQHGVIKDNMSSWLRKYDRNPKLIVTSAQLEYESLFDEGYNYDEDVVQLLGLPRYDNLDNKGLKKQIVIMPTWRNFLTDEGDVLNSQLFQRFNSLVNNKRLINHAKEKGYEIVFKPHPELARYLYLFDKKDYVQFDVDKKYQVIFNESSVLVTDFSSIFFDFSYLKKPLIYYQYSNDYHYDSVNGYFQYNTMGFGPVIKDEDGLVDKLIEYMDNDCVMDDIYKKRVDEFFKYYDQDNSKRCYDWIHNH